jgi:Tfp pilus assembly protein PilN
VLGALAFAVVATALSVLAGNSIKDRKAELARVTAEAQATQARATSLQSYADFATLADQRVLTVRSLAASRFDWQRTLDDLAKALPSDVHLRGIDASTQTGTGASSSGLRSSIQAPAITLTGCTRTQTSVARLMSRLRNVRGVTRVALAQSEKSAAAAAAPTPGEASLCPKGSPPEFDMTMFFERATLPAASAVNATAAGTTTTAAATATPAAGAAATPAATTGATTTTSTGTTK